MTDLQKGWINRQFARIEREDPQNRIAVLEAENTKLKASIPAGSGRLSFAEFSRAAHRGIGPTRFHLPRLATRTQ